MVVLGQSKFTKFKSKNTYFGGGQFSCSLSFDQKIDPMGYFPSGPGVKTMHFQCRGDWVCSLVGELRSPTCYEAKI